jgi:hypothetical protein
MLLARLFASLPWWRSTMCPSTPDARRGCSPDVRAVKPRKKFWALRALIDAVEIALLVGELCEDRQRAMVRPR